MNFTDKEMKENFEQIRLEELKTIDKIYYYKIREEQGLKNEASDLYALSLEMNNRLQTLYYEDFFYEPRAAMFMAYYLFSGSSMGNEWLDVFKSKLLNGQLEKNLNTYAKASMIEALTRSVEVSGSKPITAEVVINDTLKVKTFPYSLPITGNNYRMKHTGGDVFVNTAEEKWIFNPKKTDSLYDVSTSFIQKEQSRVNLKAGIPCQLNVVVNAFRSKEYVMLEIPIPSGMRVVTKRQLPGCTIEYFKHKIVVFYNTLSMDRHQLVFEMNPVMKGSFIIPAAKCSLMYYPYIYGNNQTTSIEVN